VSAAASTSLLSPRDGYARWARSYDHTPNPLLALERRVLAPMISCVVGRRVLDLGCGTGRWLERLVGVGAHAIGIDFSPEMLNEAARKNGMRGRLVQADLSNIPCADATFDVVLCSFVLEHCADLSSLADELSRVTRPACSLYITQLHPDAARSGWQCGFQDSDGRVEVAAQPHCLDHVRGAFEPRGFRLARSSEPTLGKPERPLFIASGRERAFPQACALPALLVCEFRRGAE